MRVKLQVMTDPLQTGGPDRAVVRHDDHSPPCVWNETPSQNNTHAMATWALEYYVTVSHHVVALTWVLLLGAIANGCSSSLIGGSWKVVSDLPSIRCLS
jgi:hypothetical protein